MPTIDSASLDGEGAPALEGGSVFGGYRIERLLGAGAMGEVYLARQVRLERPCAVKILPRELSRSRYFSKRFEAEGRVLAKLDHPGIVRVQNAGEDGGRHFLEMEYVEEGNLDECLLKNGGRLEASRVRTLLVEILEALAYAHEKGVVHRDLKPSNILVTREGRCKISDFGLVLVAGEEFVHSVVQRSLVLSQLAGQGMAFAPPGPGMNSQAPDSGSPAKPRAGSADPASVVGTPYYMSPEVQAGTGADARSDIFAVGVMAYRMLTGRLPRGMAKPPSKLVKGLDPAWDGWAAKCMEEEPEERFQSAKEALEVLPGRIRQPSVEEIAARYKAEIEALRAGNERLEKERKDSGTSFEAVRKVAEEAEKKRMEQERTLREAVVKTELERSMASKEIIRKPRSRTRRFLAIVVLAVFLGVVVGLITTAVVDPVTTQPEEPSRPVTLVASDRVDVLVLRKSDGARLYSGTLSAGQTHVVKAAGQVEIRFSSGKALMVERDGVRNRFTVDGTGRTILE